MRIHLDTDFAGDTDDAGGLAMVLGWPDTEIVGITTVATPTACAPAMCSAPELSPYG